jgi:multiple sugar transport system permease protein
MTAGPAQTPQTAVAAATTPVVRPQRRLWRQRTTPKALAFVVLLAATTLLFLYPFVWAISASLKPRGQVFDNRLIPQTFHPSNYPDLFNGVEDIAYKAPYAHWLINSLYIGLLAAGTVTVSSALVAFAFAYFRFPLRNVLFGCVLATMMLPSAVMMIPTYLIWNQVGLADSQVPLWAQNLFGSAFYIFLLRQFFLGIPRELFEAARVDGDNYWTMFWRIAAPLAKPALIVTFIFEFKASWTDLIHPLIYLRDDPQFTVPRGLKTLLDLYGPGAGGHGDYQVVIAGTVLATLPMILVFFLGQRYFVEGIATQGRKG